MRYFGKFCQRRFFVDKFQTIQLVKQGAVKSNPEKRGEQTFTALQGEQKERMTKAM